jgi:hypothetical protein
MSVSIESAFIKQFEREVHGAYQRTGSKLRSTVRVINDVNGATCVFQKVGKATVLRVNWRFDKSLSSVR